MKAFLPVVVVFCFDFQLSAAFPQFHRNQPQYHPVVLGPQPFPLGYRQDTSRPVRHGGYLLQTTQAPPPPSPRHPPSPTLPPRFDDPSNPKVDCQPREVAPGKYIFFCDGIDRQQITVENKHILWLKLNGDNSEDVRIVVPNYKINELIQAGYKPGNGLKTRINVLLRRPETWTDAEVEVPRLPPGSTDVKLQYEQPKPELIHFPRDQQYRPLSGPILPPYNP